MPRLLFFRILCFYTYHFRRTLSGFDLTNYTPKLKHLDLSNNRIGQLTALLSIRELPLTTIALEGNPLCLDYIHSELYIKALKMMFPALKEIVSCPLLFFIVGNVVRQIHF